MREPEVVDVPAGAVPAVDRHPSPSSDPASRPVVVEPDLDGAPDPAPSAERWWTDLWKPVVAYVVARVVLLVAWAAQGSVRGAVLGWDSGWYLSVLVGGYSTQVPPGADPGQANVAFFPGYPVLGRVLSRTLPLTPVQALLVITLVGGLVATCVLWWFARRLWGPVVADRATVLFAAWAGTFSLSMLYSEGLFLACAVSACYLFWTQRYLAAGLLGAAATATRSTGTAVCVAFLVGTVLVWRSPQRWRAVGALVVSGSGLVGYFTYLRVTTGSWTTWFDVEHAGWGSRTSLFDARYRDFRNAVHFVLNWDDRDWMALTSTIGLGVTGLGILLLLYKRGPAMLVAYSLAMSATCFVSAPIGFRPRMVLVIFPVFMGYAAALRSRLQFVLLTGVFGAGAIGMALVIAESRVLTP